MKATHTKEYFEKHREALFEKYERQCDFERRLKILLPDLTTFPTAAVEIVTKMYAERVAASAKEELLKKAHTIKEIRAGRASLGYTTVQQEVREWHDLNEGFEFSCYMLAEFKARHKIRG